MIPKPLKTVRGAHLGTEANWPPRALTRAQRTWPWRGYVEPPHFRRSERTPAAAPSPLVVDTCLYTTLEPLLFETERNARAHPEHRTLLFRYHEHASQWCARRGKLHPSCRLESPRRSPRSRCSSLGYPTRRQRIATPELAIACVLVLSRCEDS